MEFEGEVRRVLELRKLTPISKLCNFGDVKASEADVILSKGQPYLFHQNKQTSRGD